MSENLMNSQHNEAFLLSAADSIEAGMIEQLLNANGIPVLKKYKGMGGFLKIYMGDSIYGVDLYVPAELLDKAREIIENIREAEQNDEFPCNVITEETNDSSQAENHPTNYDVLMKDNSTEQAEQEQENNSKKRLISWLIILLFVSGLVGIVVHLLRRFLGGK